MIKLNAEKLTPKENYKLLTGSIIPRPIALVTTLNEKGSVNIAPFSFFTVVASNPPIIAISVQKDQSVQKDTTKNILRQKEAVIHVVDESNLEEANKTASRLPYEESELNLTNFTLGNSDSISTPALNETKIRLEAVLYQHLEIASVSDLILLEIKQFQLDESVYQQTYILPDKLKPMARLAGNYYSKLGERIEMERPQ